VIVDADADPAARPLRRRIAAAAAGLVVAVAILMRRVSA